MESRKHIVPVPETPINPIYFTKFWSLAKSLAGAIKFAIPPYLVNESAIAQWINRSMLFDKAKFYEIIVGY
jgi:hypothetical protein